MLAVAVSCGPVAQASADECQASAQKFWSNFRLAVMAGDAAKIAALARTPVAVEGTLEEPMTSLAKTDIERRLPELLAADTGLKEDNYPMRQLVADTAMPDVQCAGGAGAFRVGSMAFERAGGEWGLVKIYSE